MLDRSEGLDPTQGGRGMPAQRLVPVLYHDKLSLLSRPLGFPGQQEINYWITREQLST
jgi:hypothetical protein